MVKKGLAALCAAAAAACGGGGADAGAPAPPQPPPGTLVVQWTVPLVNADGSPADVAGYRVRYGTDRNLLTEALNVPGAATTTVQVDGLAPGTYFVSVESVNAALEASDPSNIASVVLLR